MMLQLTFFRLLLLQVLRSKHHKPTSDKVKQNILPVKRRRSSEVFILVNKKNVKRQLLEEFLTNLLKPLGEFSKSVEENSAQQLVYLKCL